MELFEDLETLSARLKPSAGTVVTIGAFDGLHQGHQALVARAVEGARAAGLLSLIMTFQNHPLCTLAPPYCPKRLLERRRKHALLAGMGVDVTADVAFTEEFAAIAAEDFVTKTLLQECRARRVVCGYDFTFGRAGAGDMELLREMGRRLGFEVDVLEPVADQAIAVKSTMIRDCLLSGDVERAARLLTRPYDLAGQVASRSGRGRTLGFPTANVQVDAARVIPARGVYFCAAQLESCPDAVRGAMVNIGHSPTFGEHQLAIEAHLLDFDGELVGSELRLHFLKRLRDERKFSGPEELIGQLERDRDESRRLLAELETGRTMETVARSA